jgi:hypothetical protein
MSVTSLGSPYNGDTLEAKSTNEIPKALVSFQRCLQCLHLSLAGAFSPACNYTHQLSQLTSPYDPQCSRRNDRDHLGTLSSLNCKRIEALQRYQYDLKCNQPALAQNTLARLALKRSTVAISVLCTWSETLPNHTRANSRKVWCPGSHPCARAGWWSCFKVADPAASQPAATGTTGGRRVAASYLHGNAGRIAHPVVGVASSGRRVPSTIGTLCTRYKSVLLCCDHPKHTTSLGCRAH